MAETITKTYRLPAQWYDRRGMELLSSPDIEKIIKNGIAITVFEYDMKPCPPDCKDRSMKQKYEFLKSFIINTEFDPKCYPGEIDARIRLDTDLVIFLEEYAIKRKMTPAQILILFYHRGLECWNRYDIIKQHIADCLKKMTQ